MTSAEPLSQGSAFDPPRPPRNLGVLCAKPFLGLRSVPAKMTWVQGVVAYVIIWWLVIFAVLPFGVRPATRDDIGHAAGAPANPRLWLKAGVTTLVATAVWLGFYAVVASDLIPLREP